uniref:glycosyltransferase n=1 Tax=Cronobacter sakazakii TaxID=28141 RepID=UPI001F3516D2
HYNYTVVSAVYNVGAFLDDYFESFIRQRLKFKKHIQLIMVDDGSTDNSAEIIKRWQKKYPNNITYIYQENAGQSSARNNGLQHVTTEWVTFIDMAANQARKLDKLRFKKEDGHYNYTVVSAVYNVGAFLDDYFESFIRQRLKFKK